MTAYPMLRAGLDPAWRDVSDDFLDAWIPLTHGGMAAEDLENFWKSVARLSKAATPMLQQAGQVAVQALPGVIQGATAGAALGPYGAIAGGVLGGVGSVLGNAGGAGPRTAGAGAQPPAAPPPHVGAGGGPVPTGTPQAAAATAPSSAAVLQLLRLLNDPSVIRAIRSASMGALGRTEVTVRGEQAATVDVLDALADAVAEVADTAREVAAVENATVGSTWVHRSLEVRPIAGRFTDAVAEASDAFAARTPIHAFAR